MRKLIVITLLIAAIATGLGASSSNPLDISLKKLFAGPSDTTKIVFEIPIEVKILDVSSDFDWYKVNISFKLGPFEQSHTGWVKIPFDEILLAHQ